MSVPADAGDDGSRTSDQSRTSEWYRTRPGLPKRFQHPGCFRGYGQPQPHPLYRTSNQEYGRIAPTVHDVPTSYHTVPHSLSNTLERCGMYRDNGLNTALDKSYVTGPANFITAYDHFNFHPSYNPNCPSYC